MEFIMMALIVITVQQSHKCNDDNFQNMATYECEQVADADLHLICHEIDK